MENQTNYTKKIILVLAFYAAFALIAWTVVSGVAYGFDAPVQEFILGLRNGVLSALLVPFAYSGNWFCVDPKEDLTCVYLTTNLPGDHYSFIPRLMASMYASLD